MTLTAPPTNRIRGYGPRGSVIPTVEVTALTAPTVTLAQVTGRALSATITDLDPYADGVELQLDANATPSTLVATYLYFAMEVYNTGDIGDAQTRYSRARAFVDTTTGRIYSNWSTVDSEITASAVPAPGAPSNLIVTDNGDGTVSASWVLADAYHNESRFQIWVQGSTSWVTLVDNDSNLSAESVSAVAVPGSSGATVNAQGQYGFRERVAQSGTNTVTSEYWVAVGSGAGFTPGTASLTVNNSTQINVQFGTDPSVTPDSVQVQRTLTANEGDDGSWINISGATNYATLTGSGFNDTNSASTAYSYRIQVVSGGVTKYTPIARSTTPASTGSTVLMSWSDNSSPSPFTLSGTAQVTSGGGLAYAGHTNYIRMDYPASSAGVKATIQAALSSYNLQEVYIEFSARMQRPFNSKWLKVHGKANPAGKWSNCTFSAAGSASDLRVWTLHGTNNEGPNDTQKIVRSDGSWAGGVPTSPAPTYTETNSVVVDPDDTWADYRFRVKFANAVEGNGLFEGWRKDSGVWDRKFLIQTLVNAQDNKPGIDRITWGDYSNGSQSLSAYMLVDNIKILSDGWSS